MTMLTSKNLVAFALIAIASLAFLSVGCSRDEGSREGSGAAAGDGSAGVERMSDPEYVTGLNAHNDVRKELMKTRQSLVSKMEAMIADAKVRLGTDDEAVLKVELEKDAEWNSLYNRVIDIDKAIEDNRARASTFIRNRIIADQEKGSAAQ